MVKRLQIEILLKITKMISPALIGGSSFSYEFITSPLPLTVYHFHSYNTKVVSVYFCWNSRHLCLMWYIRREQNAPTFEAIKLSVVEDSAIEFTLMGWKWGSSQVFSFWKFLDLCNFRMHFGFLSCLSYKHPFLEVSWFV